MKKTHGKLAVIGIFLSLVLLFAAEPRFAAQDDSTHLRVNVVLVQLNIAVTDHKGNYVSGLRPEDFIVTEDKIPEKIATFEEGNGAPRPLDSAGHSVQGTEAGNPPRPAPRTAR